MFVTQNQFYVFLACIAFGAIGGTLFSLFRLLSLAVNIKVIKVVFDALFFIIFAFGMVIYSFYLNLPSIRAYMIIGNFLGLFLYIKSFHIILAKALKMAYNNIKRKRSKAKDDRDKV